MLRVFDFLLAVVVVVVVVVLVVVVVIVVVEEADHEPAEVIVNSKSYIIDRK